MLISKDSVILHQLKKSKRLDFNKLGRAAIQKNAEEIVQLNRDQVRLGVAADGKDQAEYRSGIYADNKAKLFSYIAPAPIADLFLTGAFQNAFFLKIEGNEVLISSSDSKTPELVKVWRPIFGLTEASYKVIRPKVTMEYNKQVYNELNT